MNGGMGRYTVGQTTRWLGEWVARERDGLEGWLMKGGTDW